MISDLGGGMQIGRMANDVVNFLALRLTRPLGLLTQVLFRRDMGERYFTGIAAFLGLALIAGATFLTINMPVDLGGMNTSARSIYAKPTTANHVPAYTIGGAWAGLFVLAALDQRARTRARYRTATRWHSMCMGVPRMAGLSNVAQYGAVAVGAGALGYFGYYIFAGLAAASLWAGVMADSLARALFWNRVLNAMDSQIETEVIGKAIEQRLSPAAAEGVDASVPAIVSDEYRSKIIAAISAPAAVAVVEAKPLHGSDRERPLAATLDGAGSSIR